MYKFSRGGVPKAYCPKQKCVPLVGVGKNNRRRKALKPYGTLIGCGVYAMYLEEGRNIFIGTVEEANI
jgi:hypothetical protein